VKIDQRKRASKEVIAKRTQNGKRFGENFEIRSKTHKSSADRLQERIEMVVAMAEAKDAARLLGQDVIRYNRSPLLLSRMQAHKIA
jgi:hypothetical protein